MMVTQVPPPSANCDGTGPVSAPSLKPVAPPRAGRALRAAFYAEFRPHLPLAWLLLLSCGVMAGLVSFMNYLDYHHYYVRDFDNVLSNNWVQFLTLVGCPLIGLLLGVAQARRDVAVDVWGFMAHRPVSGALLFAGRVLAGGALYGIAAGLPLAALLAFAASPGGGLPFHWRFILPALADGLSGVVYYFAGLLMVQRESRWVGSRYLPMLTAIGCSVLMAVVPLFSEAVLVIAVCTGFFAVAALGAAQSNGYRLAGRGWCRWATGAILLAALAPIFLGGGMALQYGNLSLADAAMHDLPREQTDYSLKFASSSVLLADGTLGMRIYEAPEGPLVPGEGTAKHFRYERVWPVKEKVDISGQDERSIVTEPVEFTESARAADSYRQLGWQVEYVYFPKAAGPANSPQTLKEQWYCIPLAGVLYGYDAATHAYLGSIGENGFAPPGQHAVPFGVAGGSRWITTPRGQFEVDLDRRTVTLKRAFPADEKVRLVAGVPASADPDAPRLEVLTSDRMLVYTDASAKPALALPLAYGADTHAISVAWFPEQHRWALWYEPRNDRSKNNVVEFFDQAGTQLGRVDVAVRFNYEWRGNPPTTLPPGREAIVRKALAMAGAIEAAGGLPGNLLMVHFSVLPLYGDYGDYVDWFGDSSELRLHSWAYCGTAGLTLALSAVGMGLLARRYGVRHKWAWVAATVVLGPVMLVLLAALHTLPLRVRCAACQKRRFANASRCGHCGAAFADPARRATEIFTSVSGGAA